jgi:Tfp pilus assembly protein PilP
MFFDEMFCNILSYFSEDLYKCRYVLQTSVCNERKTHQQVVKEINSVLTRFELESIDITYVTDKGANMVAAIQAMGTPHHLCLGMYKCLFI